MSNLDAQPVADALRRSATDASAFASFYRKHADRLVAHFMSRVGEPEVALDLTSETLAQSFLGRTRFRGTTDAEAGAWLYGIAERQLASYFRRHQVEQRALRRLGLERTEPIPEAEANMIERETLAEMQEVIRPVLERLSAPQREAVELRVIQEVPYSKIAERLQISEEAARARVARGLSAMRGQISTRPAVTKTMPWTTKEET